MTAQTSNPAKQNVSPALAASLISLVVGGALGYYANYFLSPERPPAAATAGMSRPGGGGGYGGGGYGGGGGGYGGGGQQAGGMALARLVRNLDTVQKVQGQGLTPAQSKELLPILTQVKSAEKLPAADADKQTAAIEKILTPAQKEALAGLQPNAEEAEAEEVMAVGAGAEVMAVGAHAPTRKNPSQPNVTKPPSTA